MILFALRHADRTTDGDQLSPAGVKRAELLARMLGESGVRIALCSDAARTQQTVAPLKNALGAALKVVVVRTDGPRRHQRAHSRHREQAGGVAARRRCRGGRSYQHDQAHHRRDRRKEPRPDRRKRVRQIVRSRFIGNCGADALWRKDFLKHRIGLSALFSQRPGARCRAFWQPTGRPRAGQGFTTWPTAPSADTSAS